MSSGLIMFELLIKWFLLANYNSLFKSLQKLLIVWLIWPVFLSNPSRRQDSPLPPIFSGSLGTHNERIVSQQFSHKDTPSLFFIAAVKRKSGKLKKRKRSIKPILSIFFYKNVKFVVFVFLCCLWQFIMLFMAVNYWCIERPVAGGHRCTYPPFNSL